MTTVLAEAPELTIDYVNWRGHRATRHVVPRELVWGSTQWHGEAQWLLRAFDLDKEAERQFAVKDIMDWSCPNCGIISHGDEEQALEELLAARREEIVASGEMVERKLDVLEQLSGFALGRYLLLHRGLNGFWTDYLIRARGVSLFNHPLEEMICHRAPMALATQERFGIFQEQIVRLAGEGDRIASVPCGLMDDLLSAELPDGVELVGSDLDLDSLLRACKRASEMERSEQVRFLLNDAWELPWQEEVDLFLSNGLSIYEPDDVRLVELYRKFNDALKPGGALLTSFLTPPTDWNMELFDPQDLLVQRLILVDVAKLRLSIYRTAEQTRALLEEAGFVDIEVMADAANVMPTVIARRGL